MPPDQSQSDRTAVTVVGLLRRGCWAAVQTGTIESLIAGGRVVEFSSGHTVYADSATIAGPERYLAGHPLMVVTLVFVQIVATLALIEVLATRSAPDTSMAGGPVRAPQISQA